MTLRSSGSASLHRLRNEAAYAVRHGPLVMSEASLAFRFVLAVLATWRIVHLLASEPGPQGSIAQVRARLEGTWAGKVVGCFGCTSLWIAIPFAFYVGGGATDVLLAWLALSGGAFLLERTGPEPVVIERIVDTSEKESNDGMLRPATVDPEPTATAGGERTAGR